MRSRSVHQFVYYAFILLFNAFYANVHSVECGETELRDECGHTLIRPSGFFQRHFDLNFLKKVFKHWVPFTSSDRVKMQFFLYKRDFPECGRELFTDENEILKMSGFDAKHPTRIIIHGWMSQSKGSLNRAVKNAYLSLTKPTLAANINASGEFENFVTAAPQQIEANNTIDDSSEAIVDFNVIVADWSIIASNVNYFGVVDLVEDLGFLLAEFVRQLHLHAGLHYDDVYLIGHSLGAQIAGSAGKQVQPFRFNTIFALDPAAPKFRDLGPDSRLDPTDAHYVESIQTSNTFGFEQSVVGHATFYPNFGRDQKKCYVYGCSHSRAHNYFAESITSGRGFWGTPCERVTNEVWKLPETDVEVRMGGEPSQPKHGSFYVKTNDKPPYALGKMRRPHTEPRPIDDHTENYVGVG